jgi:hypothetical protein
VAESQNYKVCKLKSKQFRRANPFAARSEIGDASTQKHCQGSDGTQAGGALVLDVAEWM